MGHPHGDVQRTQPHGAFGVFNGGPRVAQGAANGGACQPGPIGVGVDGERTVDQRRSLVQITFEEADRHARLPQHIGVRAVRLERRLGQPDGLDLVGVGNHQTLELHRTAVAI